MDLTNLAFRKMPTNRVFNTYFYKSQEDTL